MSFSRIIALITTIVLLVPFVTGCSKEATSQQSPSVITDVRPTVSSNKTPIELTTEQITEQLVESITESLHAQHEPKAEPVNISHEWEDYAGDLDTFVYGLMLKEYELDYSVFNAALMLPDGSAIYGIGYTDYSDFYQSDDGMGFFPAGFISLIGEPEIPADQIEKGLEIHDLDYDGTDIDFVYAYECEPYLEHCVIWDQYLQYGVDDKGAITYNADKYQRGECNESLGPLYSYDEERYVYDPDVGNYIPITGVSLSEQLDYAELEAELNRHLAEQERNYSQQEIIQTIAFAREALTNYLLSMQEATFMGYQVSELAKMAEKIDPKDCIRFTPEGAVVVDVSKDVIKSPDAATKWLVGISCGIVLAASIALSIFVPPLAPLSGALSGVAVEVFMQVVIENQDVPDINWSKVAVACVSGALLAWACPLLSQGAVNIVSQKITNEALKKLAGYATLTFSNALVSGATSAAYSLIDGKSKKDVLDSFLIGAAVGGASTAAALAVNEIGAKIGTKVVNAIKNKPNSWLAKLTNKLEGAKAWIGEHQITFKKQPSTPSNAEQITTLDDTLVPKTEYEAAKSATSEVSSTSSGNQPIKNKVEGLRREREVAVTLNQQYPEDDGYYVLSERLICNSDGVVIKCQRPPILSSKSERNLSRVGTVFCQGQGG